MGVRSNVWPNEKCNELQGAGWQVEVLSASSKSALVRFTTARTATGRPYKEVRLPLSALHRLDRASHSAANAGSNPVGTRATTHPQNRRTPKKPPACHALVRAPPSTSNYTVRGGCAQHLQPQDRPDAPAIAGSPKPGNRNKRNYPQLVASDTCALCKARLDPLSGPNTPMPLPPTNCATPERLQCERCGLVRYCSAWCAHVHYLACHRHQCPLPRFDVNFNAEYVERRGNQVTTIPIRGIRTDLMLGGKFPTTSDQDHALAARTHVWTVVPHKASTSLNRAFQCEWCTRPLTDPAAPPEHNVWFVACITRIRPTATFCSAPFVPTGLRPPLTIYPSSPQCLGDPRSTWPEPDDQARWPMPDHPPNTGGQGPPAGP